MKTMRLCFGAVVAACMFVLASRCQGVQFNLSLPVPRLVSVCAPATGGLPAISLQFQYDASGKLLLAPGSMVGTNPVTGSTALVLKPNGASSYTITAKGTTNKTLTVSLKGLLASGLASCSYKNGTIKYSLTNLAISLSNVVPVTAQATFSPQISDKGKITGTGAIISGYGNETTNTATLKGQLTKGKLTLQVVQGRQQLTFNGSGGSTGFVGTLTITLPPGKAAFKNFALPALPDSNGPVTGVLATFTGKVSQLPAQGGLPSVAPGATVTVGSDLNGNGVIDAYEQFSTQTDGDGSYAFQCLITNGSRAVLQFSLPGFGKQLKVLEPVQGGVTMQNNVLLRPLMDLNISGKTATSIDGKLELKNLPSTIASIQGRAFNPVTEADQFPGAFADDQKNLLVSSAFAAIEATDGSGKPVHQLGATTTVRILVPQDTWNTLRDLTSGNNQIDVPLYYFDETTGQWKRSNSNGWLEDDNGAKLAEAQLSSLRDGTYVGKVYGVGPVTHLSYWNIDWPIETHTCVHALVLDTNGVPVAGAAVTVKGVTYNGTTSPKITGGDGAFCAEVMRSEQPGEDINDNGISGETQSVAVTVYTGTNYYNFGPFAAPQTQGTCEQGTCLDVGPLVLSDTNQLGVSLCTVTGSVVYAGTNVPSLPVASAYVYGFDENLDPAIAEQYMTNDFSFFATADTNGVFTLTAPTLTGLTLWTFSDITPPGATNTYEQVYGTATLSGCPTQPVTLQADWWRGYGMNGSGITDNNGWLYQFEGSLDCWFTIGSTYYWGLPQTGTRPQVPTQPGQSLTLDLYRYMPSYAKVGTITFTATTSIGGTWSTQGVSLSGTWGN